MTERRSFLVYAGGLFVLLAVFYFRFLSGSRSFYMEDITQFFEPLLNFIGCEMARGRLPLWNPYEYCGMPQVALTSPGVFYPTTVLFAWLPFNQALALNMVVHQWLAGVGAFLLVSSLGWGFTASACCGLIMSMNGYMFSSSTNYTLCAACAWCPFTFWSFLKLATSQKSRWLWTSISAVFVALLIAAGRPEISFPQLLLLASMALWVRFKKDSGFAPETGLWQMRALMIGALVAMPSLLPALEWAGLSRRASGMLPFEVFLYSANWYDFLCLLAMSPLGDLQLHLSPMRALVMPQSLTPYLSSCYLGPVAIALATFGLFDEKFRLRFLLLFGLFVSVLLAAGCNTPLAPFLVKLFPALSLIRFPVKLLFFLIFAVALLAARGVFRLERGVRVFNESFFFFSVLAVAGLVAALMAQSGIALIAPVAPLPLPSVLGGERACAIALGCTSLFAALLSLLLAAKEKIRLLLFGCLALLGASLFLSAWQFSNQEGPPDFFKRPSRVADRLTALSRSLSPEKQGESASRADSVRPVRVLGLYLERFTMPLELTSTERRAGTVDVYDYARQLLRPNTNIDFGIASPAGFEGAMVGDYYYTLLNLYGRSSQSVTMEPALTGKSPGIALSAASSAASSAAFGAASSVAFGADSGKASGTTISAVAPVAPGITAGPAPGPAPNAACTAPVDDEGLYRFCQMTATQFVVTQCRRFQTTGDAAPASMSSIPLLSSRYFALEEQDEQLDFRLYRLRETLPRIYLSTRWRWLDSHRQAEHDVFDVASSRFDPVSLTLIERDREESGSRSPNQGDQGDEAGSRLSTDAASAESVQVIEDLPAALTCRVKTGKPGFLVVCDQFYPGWIASVDGRQATILRANAFMRAVAVEPGVHQVSFQFRPRSLSIGFTLTFIALLWLCVLGISERLSEHKGSLRALKKSPGSEEKEPGSEGD